MNDIQSRFINEIVNSEIVFCLEDTNGIAFSESLLFKADDGEAIPVLCFWSNKQMVEASRIDGWLNFKIHEMCLATFIEDWLVQIYNDSLIVGLNFNSSMEGVECDPLDLISAIIQNLKKENRDLEFEYFKDISDVEKQIKSLNK